MVALLVRSWGAIAFIVGVYIFVLPQMYPSLPYVNDISIAGVTVANKPEGEASSSFSVPVTVNGNPFTISISKTYAQQYEAYLMQKSKAFCKDNAAVLKLEETDSSSSEALPPLLDTAGFRNCVETMNNHLLAEARANFPLKIDDDDKLDDGDVKAAVVPPAPKEEPRVAVTYLPSKLTEEQLSSPLVLDVKIPVENGKVYIATFDALIDSPLNVANKFCSQNAEEFGIESFDLHHCAESVERYIITQLQLFDVSAFLDEKVTGGVGDEDVKEGGGGEGEEVVASEAIASIAEAVDMVEGQAAALVAVAATVEEQEDSIPKDTEMDATASNEEPGAVEVDQSNGVAQEQKPGADTEEPTSSSKSEL